MRMTKVRAIWIATAMLAAVGCGDNDEDNGIGPGSGSGGGGGGGGGGSGTPAPQTFVFLESNDPTGNSILGFRRSDGTLESLGAPTPTGGIGITAEPDQHIGPLASDKELVASANQSLLYAVNSGDRTVSVFQTARDGSLKSIAGSPFDTAALNPVSVGLTGTHAYVVNKVADGSAPPRYTTLDLNSAGGLQNPRAIQTPLGGSPSVAFVTRDGKFLYGTQFLDGLRALQAPVGQIDAFSIGDDGALSVVPGSPYALPADTSGITPTPLAVALNMVEHPSQNILYIGFPARNEIGVYTIDPVTGALTAMCAVPTSGLGPSWFLIDRDGKQLYVVNNLSATVATFSLMDPLTPVETSSLALANSMAGPAFVDATGVTQTKTSLPYQLAFDPDQIHIYVISQRVTTNATDPAGNFLHILTVGTNGVLAEPTAPIDLGTLGVSSRARPQGLAVITL